MDLKNITMDDLKEKLAAFDKKTLINSIKKTRKMSENQFKNITRSQISDVIRKKKSDYVIYNNSTLKDYKIKINKLISKL